MIFNVCLECLNNLHSAANEDMGKVLEAVIKAYPSNRKLIKKTSNIPNSFLIRL